MAPSVLGIGLSYTSPIVPEDRREEVKKALENVNAELNASPYDWEMFYMEPEDSFENLRQKLREKQWDVVIIGTGVRTIIMLTNFFGQIVNTVHEELPKTRFAFNSGFEDSLDAIKRALSFE